jgi:peptidylprolyl isomerase
MKTTARTLDFLWPLAVALALAPSCGAFAQSAGPVARAGNVELNEADVRRIVAGVPEASRATVLAQPAALEQLVRGELARKLVLTDLRQKGWDRDPAAVAELDRLRDEALMRTWLERQSRPPAGYPSEDEVRRAYEAGRDKLAGASEYRLAQIYVAAPDGAPADRVAAALKKVSEVQAKLPGADFGQLARQYSEHAESAAKGGDLGPLPESRLLPEVRLAVAGAKVGDVVGPIKTPQGLHFVRVLEKKPVPAPELKDVREALVAALRQQKATELQQEYLAKLGKDATVTVNQIELARLGKALK